MCQTTLGRHPVCAKSSAGRDPLCASPMPGSPGGLLGPARDECPMYVKFWARWGPRIWSALSRVSMHCAPGTMLSECPVCAVSYWVSTCHMPGLMLGEGLVSDKPSTKGGSGACQTLCLLSSQDVSSPHWLSTCHMPGLGLGEHPLCARLCDGCCRQEVSKHLSQIAEQVRVGQPQAASGAFKAF